MISNNTSTCQDCGGKLKYYDKVRRIVRTKYRTCFDCPHFNNDNFHMDCDLDYDISDIVMKHAMNPPEN